MTRHSTSSGQRGTEQRQSLSRCHIRITKPQKANAEDTTTSPQDSSQPVRMFYAVQLDFDRDRTRLLYFESEKEQKAVLEILLGEQGFASQFDQYRLVRELGLGGTSQVMLAEHRSTGEQFAMKLINLRGITSETRKQIDREIAL